jgi:hypothetical protein
VNHSEFCHPYKSAAALSQWNSVFLIDHSALHSTQFEEFYIDFFRRRLYNLLLQGQRRHEQPFKAHTIIIKPRGRPACRLFDICAAGGAAQYKKRENVWRHKRTPQKNLRQRNLP